MENEDQKPTNTTRTPTQQTLLEHPIRAAIYHQLQQTPGLTKNHLAQRLDIQPAHLTFHLNRLQNANLITLHPNETKNETLCFLTQHAHLANDDDTHLLYGRRRTRDIALYITENPGATAKQIANDLDLSISTIHYHLTKLRDNDLIQRTRIAQRDHLHPTQTLDDWTHTIGTHYERPWTNNHHPP